MRNTHLSIACTLIICVMMMLSACRTTREVSHEERSVQTSETSLTSTDSSFSFEHFLSALSVDADSIILWFGPSLVAGETGKYGRPDSLTQMNDSLAVPPFLQAGGPGSPSSLGASPRIPLARPEGIKIYGYRADASTSGERSATRLTSDSVRSHSSADEQFSEQLVKSPRTPSFLELLAAVGIAALIAGAYIIYERIHERSTHR